MATSHTLKRPRVADFEQVRGSKKVKLLWPTGLVKSISTRLEAGITDVKSSYFFRQTVNLLDAAGQDTSWHIHRFLGEGGFGKVALWVQYDEDGNIVDEVAIKEDGRSEHNVTDHDESNPIRDQYSREALVQAIANQSYAENVLYLRKFVRTTKIKLAYNDTTYQITSTPRALRYYLEYAPYGDLYGLQLRYKVFNQFFPELFLWHVFHSLAEALGSLDTPPFRNGEYDHLLHIDIKPTNILLGYEAPQDQRKIGGLQSEHIQRVAREQGIKLPHYPSIKLADFGLVYFSTHKKPIHAEKVRGGGSEGFQPPEQLRSRKKLGERGVGQVYNHYGGGFKWPIMDTEIRGRPNQTFAMSIWSVGKVMLDMISMSSPGDFKRWQASTSDEYELDNHGSMLKDFNKSIFRQNISHPNATPVEPPYPNLIELIRRCMLAEPKLRPSLEELSLSTRTNLQKCMEDNATNSANELHYINNLDVNQFFFGKHTGNNFPFTAGNYQDLVHPGRNDPDDQNMNIDVKRVGNHPLLNVSDQSRKLARILSARNGRRKQRVWLNNPSEVRRKNGKLIFQDGLNLLPDDDKEDGSDNGHGGDSDDDDDSSSVPSGDLPDDQVIICNDGRLDLTSKPGPPPSPREMFVRFRRETSGSPPTDKELRADWNDLTLEQKAVFERAHRQAVQHHTRYSTIYAVRPIKYPPGDERPSDWHNMSPQQQEEWQNARDRQRKWKYQDEVHAWRRNARKPKGIDSGPKFYEWFQQRLEEGDPKAAESLAERETSSRERYLDEFWEGHSPSRKERYRSRFNSWLQHQSEDASDKIPAISALKLGQPPSQEQEEAKG